MTRATKNEFPSHSFASRLPSTMLQVDGRRLRHSTMFWVMLGCALMIPILVLTMTTGFGGEGGAMFTNAWQIIGSDSAELGAMMSGMMGAMGGGTQAGAAAADPAAGAGMMSAMMNINLMYFMAAIFICLFVAEDFQSGYAKNLFTVRARKTDYVASKIIISWIAGALFLLAFFVGGVIGGKAAGLPFTLGSAGVPGLVMCLLSKLFLMGFMVSLFVLMSMIGRGRSWLSILLALFAGMLLFMMIPMLTPLDAGIAQAGLCLAGSVCFAPAFGAVGNLLLKQSNLA